MATQVQIRRGTSSQVAAFTGAEGEIVVNTTNDSVHVNDGSTAGGFEMARVDGSNWAITNAISTTANISFGDNDKAIFGAGSDLQIYHDGTRSYISDSGTGDLRLQASEVRMVNAANTEVGFKFVEDGAASLYFNANEKLATTGSGIDVTGTVTADGGVFQSTGATEITLEDTDGGFSASKINVQNGGRDLKVTAPQDIILNVGSSDAVTILNGGNVGIGIAPSKKLTVFGTGVGNATVQIEGEGGADPYINFLANNAQHWSLGIDDSDSDKFKLSEHSALGTNDYFVVDVTGNVGIGTQTPQAAKFSGSAVGILELANTKPVINIHETDVTDAELFMGMSGGSAVIGTTGNGKLIFQTGTSSASISAIIDASGNLLVGGTDTDPGSTGNSANAGTAIGASGYVSVARTGGSAIRAGRIDSDGAIIELFGDGTQVGTIVSRAGVVSSFVFDPRTNGSGLSGGTQQIQPANQNGAVVDNSIDLGSSTTRFKDLYRSGSTISTSDRNMKQDIRDLTDAERNVAVAAKGLLKAFRFIDTVEAEGDSANIHFGIIAQDLAAAFTAEGLDANDYQVYRADTFTDDDGNEQTRLGICYENLLAFIISAI